MKILTLSDPDYRRRKSAEIRIRLCHLPRTKIAEETGLSLRAIHYFFNDQGLARQWTVARLERYADAIAYGRDGDR